VRKLVLMLAALGAVLTVTAAALAGVHGANWSTTLSAAQEIPKQTAATPAAHGAFTATLTGSKLTWKLTFSQLSGPATAAHIHLGAKGKAGNVLIPLCTPCKSGVSGTATLKSSVKTDFTKHLLYVNVHTAKNPAGEIRGQLGG
jgi:CHRD domain